MKRRWAGIAALLWLACSSHDIEPDVVVQGDQPDQEIWNFSVTATDRGNLQAVIRAGHMRRYANRSLLIFDQGVHIDFYDQDGKHASVLTAEGGELDDNTTNVKAIGNVVVKSDSGFTLYTDELFFNKERNRIYSNVTVMVTTDKGDTLRGVGFESDTQMNDWHIQKPFEGIIHKGADLQFKSKKPSRKDSILVAPDSAAVEKRE
ncbi:MAG: LPS export ABC transporter periplasmic protein LptC [candidate division KSB1 bacterium]|nr:LPS export ABC transporter periplasmic protein LptC [candidate division KSB1 bacterium]